MFVGITNTPRPYAWGSLTAIADQLGYFASGDPEAELWLGAHQGSASTIVDPALVGGATDLAEWIAAEPSLALGRFATTGRLPFLLKILAAGAPLSLQAHPTTAQAREGFRRENAAGVPLDAPHRNYKDEHPKPELIYALSETFDALCGFRPLADFRSLIASLPSFPEFDDLLSRTVGDDALPGFVRWLSKGGSRVDDLVARVTALAGTTESLATARLLAEQYPGDPGIVVSLLLNRVTLRRGEALYLPAGNIHAYLSGLGVELMVASDNVLRGGLTPKHVDVAELMSVLDFTPVDPPYLRPEHPAGGVEVFRPDMPDFVLVRFSGNSGPANYKVTGPAIAICTSGSAVLSGTSLSAASPMRLERGSAAFITPDEETITVDGPGEVFLATTG